jgi:hypothetical protein
MVKMFKSLNFHDQELTLDHTVKFRRHRPLKKLRNPSLNLRSGP